MQLTFKHAEQSDLSSIVATYNATIASRLVTADLEPVTIDSKQAWFDSHNTTSRPLWLVLLNNEYVGWMSFNSFYGRPAYNETVEISIYLEETVQGKGIGKACLNKAFEFCKECGIYTLLGFIFDHNTPSLNLFYKMGFKKWGHLPNIANMITEKRGLIIVGKEICL